MTLEKLTHVLLKKFLVRNHIGVNVFKRNFNYKKLWGQLLSQDAKCSSSQTVDRSAISTLGNYPLTEKSMAIALRCYREGRVHCDDLRLLTGLGTLPPDTGNQTENEKGSEGNNNAPNPDSQAPQTNEEQPHEPPTNPHFRVKANISFKVPFTCYASTDPSKIKLVEKTRINC